jgi:CAAX protease family protein
VIEQAANQILADLANCLVLALLLALVIYGYWRRRGIALAPVGRVMPVGCDLIDGLLAVGLVWLLRSVVVQTAAAGETGATRRLAGEDVIVGVLISLALGGVIVFYLRVLRGRRLMEWFGLERITLWRAVLSAVGFVIVAFIVVVVIAQLISKTVLGPLGFDDSPQEIVRTFSDAPHPLFRLLIAVTACAIAPAVEELTFRGFLYPVFKTFTDAPFAALFTALLFGAVHQHLGGFLPLSALGLLLVVAYEMTGSLMVPVIIHALFNTVSVIIIWLAGPTLNL